MAHLKGRKTGGDAAFYDPVPPPAADYGKVSFWDGRYLADPEPFDWYHPYEALSGIIDKYVEPEDKILMTGCGTSLLTEEMYHDGFKNIFNIDTSRVAIDLMGTRCASFSRFDYSFKAPKGGGEAQAPLKAHELEGVQWHQADATDMMAYCEDKVFDVVIDKAVLDALFCSAVPQRNVLKYLQEVERVMHSTATFICFSFGQPEDRLNFLDNDDPEEKGFLAWTVDVHAIPKPTRDPYAVADLSKPSDVYYVYVCTKNEKLDNEKDLKKKHEELLKKGKKIKKKGPGRKR